MKTGRRRLFQHVLNVMVMLLLGGCAFGGGNSQVGEVPPTASGELAPPAASADFAVQKPAGPNSNPQIIRGELEPAAEFAAPIDHGRKVIREEYLQLDVQDLPTTLQQVEELIARTPGAFIEGIEQWQEEPDRRREESRARLQLRLPEDEAESVRSEIEQLGNLRHRSAQAEDVTLEYVDNESRLRNLRAHEERLLALYEQAESVEEMVSIEGELSRVREQIEVIEGRQEFLNRVTSSIRLTLELVQVEEKEFLSYRPEKPLWEEAWAGFKQSFIRLGLLLERSFVLLITILPYLFAVSILGMLLFFAGFLLRKRRRKDERQ